jgi:hypothetical protein
MRVVEETCGRVYGNLINKRGGLEVEGVEILDNSWKIYFL